MKKCLFLCAALALLPVLATAEPLATGIGPRIGVSTGPDQLTIGGQIELAEVAPDLTFSPNLELGFGDNVTTIQLNGDLLYHFRIEGSVWRPYLGGGIGIAFYNYDNGNGNGDSSDTKAGMNVVLGAVAPTQSGSRFFSELRLGVGDVPDLKLLVGWNFKL